ncbi:MAG: hypothetical protein QM726_10480 [Chitinophagaceae bacterium]
MDKLSFWHKLAFIANICWVLTWLIRYNLFMPNKEIQSTIIVTGMLVAIVVNFLVNIVSGFYWSRKKLTGKVPHWLAIVNFIFLIAQLYIYIK